MLLTDMDKTRKTSSSSRFGPITVVKIKKNRQETAAMIASEI